VKERGKTKKERAKRRKKTCKNSLTNIILLPRVLEPVTPEYQPSPHVPYAVTELNILAHEVRKQHIPPHRKHMLHLVLLGNDRSHPSHDPSRNHKVSDVLRPVLRMAKEQGWPVLLEATSEKSRDVYKHVGMEVLEELTVGKGTVGRDGRKKEGGEGCVLWTMIARCD
jgi:hypothetical protein